MRSHSLLPLTRTVGKPILIASVSVGLMLLPAAQAADTFGNGTVITPTTASGGTGTAANLQTDNDTRYGVAKGATATIGGFGGHAGAINSVHLFAQYSVESGYSGSNALRVNGVDTTIIPAERDYGRWGYIEITGGSFGIDTTAEIESMVVTFNNNDGGSGDSVLFDCVYVVVNPQNPIPILPTWCEDFNGTGQADPMVWVYEVGYQRNNELQYYVPGVANGWQENGNFIIEGRKDTANEYPGYDYTSASIVTANKYDWKYGRARIRAKIPALPGMWPAIWGTGEVGQWPYNGEVDIMEYYQNKILANCAVGNGQQWTAKWDSSNRTMASLTAVDSDWKTQWHVWTMQWDEQNVRLYVDNILMNTIPQTWLKNTDGYNTSWGPQYPFISNGMSCWLNLAMGGAGGDPSATMNSGSQRYLIDYWKIWEGATGNATPTDITLDSYEVNEGLPAGAVVGNLTAMDPDPAEVIRYQLVAGTGATHNSQFTIPEFVSDNTLQGVLMTTAVLDYDAGAIRSIRVRATDIEGATYEKALTINVVPAQVIIVSQSQLSVVEGGFNTFDVRLPILPASDVTVTVSRSSGDADLSVSSGNSLVFTPANGTDWQQVTIAAAQDADITNGTATITCVDGSGTYSSESVNVTEIENDNDPPIVDAGADQHLFLVVPASANPAPGADILLDAGLDNGANAIWEDSLGLWDANITGTGLTYIADTGSSYSGITAAYDFPGAPDNGGAQGTDLEDMGLDTQPITLELWFKPDQSASYTSNGQILWETGGSSGFGIFYNDGFVEVAHDGNKGQISTDVSALTDEFIQVVVTFDTGSSTNNFKLYVNGAIAVTASYTDTDLSGNDDAGLGRQGGGNAGGAGGGSAGTESFNGRIAIFRVYHNQILDAADVTANYDSIVGATANVSLDGSVTDPNSETTTVIWTKASGPGAVSFADPTAVDTTVKITTEGTYVLQLAADDGTTQSSDAITITIGAPSPYGNWSNGTFANPFTMADPASDPDGDNTASLLEFAFGTDPTASDNQTLSYTLDGDVDRYGIPVVQNFAAEGETPLYRAVFLRRKDHATAGITYGVAFSSELSQWTTSAASPTVLTGAASTGDYEAVSLPFPATVPANGGSESLPPRFFRIGVQSN